VARSPSPSSATASSSARISSTSRRQRCAPILPTPRRQPDNAAVPPSRRSCDDATEAWPLNIGQVYTTLSRLDRDGLIAEVERDGDRVTFRITEAGRAMLDEWYAVPVIADPPPRDELAIKLLLGVAATEVDVIELLQRQRTATFEQLQQHTVHKRRLDPDTQLPLMLLLDSLILKAEAEIRWLDLCEQRLAAQAR
jgi:DNA-binding PadR family transcriptional regulator